MARSTDTVRVRDQRAKGTEETGGIMETQTEKALVSRIRLVQLTLSKACKATIHFMRTKPLGATGVVIVLVATLVAITAPLAVPHDPWEVDSSTILQSPNTSFWCGTDMLGRDVLSRTM